MKLKRFVAPDTSKAMRMIKEAFGPDAVILSSHTVADGVEVVAAVDYDETVINSKLEQSETISSPERFSVSHEDSSPQSAIDEMRMEIKMLREMMQHQLAGFAWQNKCQESPLQMTLVKRLTECGIDLELADQFVSDIDSEKTVDQAWQEVLKRLAQAIRISQHKILEQGGIYAFVGPTGVGKTTSIAKLAARFALQHGANQLGLITMDSYRIGAHEQLLTFGKILNVNVSRADDAKSLNMILEKMQNKKLILIDTAGVSQHDERVCKQMQFINKIAFPIKPVLVLSATSQAQVLRDVIEKYHPLGIDQCVVTKCDEAVDLGTIMSVLIDQRLATSYLADGQRVPEDIRQATTLNIVTTMIEQARRKTNQKDDLEERYAKVLTRRMAHVPQ